MDEEHLAVALERRAHTDSRDIGHCIPRVLVWVMRLNVSTLSGKRVSEA
jgi:hypothetical protein